MRAQIVERQPAPARPTKAIAFVAAVAVLAAISLAARDGFAAETPKAGPTAKAAEEKAAPAQPKPISLEDYMAGVSGKSAGDQATFAKKHAGATVTWTGYLRTVSKNVSTDGTSYQLILMSHLPGAGGSPVRLFIAQFTSAAKNELLALTKEQKVTVSGTLTADQNPGLPTLANAKLSGS